jgi:prevent-host-death family protein
MWTVEEAKSKLSEVLRRARAGEPQVIGQLNPCVVISEPEFEALRAGASLGKFLLETAPRGEDIELPRRNLDRGDPFADLDEIAGDPTR